MAMLCCYGGSCRPSFLLGGLLAPGAIEMQALLLSCCDVGFTADQCCIALRPWQAVPGRQVRLQNKKSTADACLPCYAPTLLYLPLHYVFCWQGVEWN